MVKAVAAVHCHNVEKELLILIDKESISVKGDFTRTEVDGVPDDLSS